MLKWSQVLEKPVSGIRLAPTSSLLWGSAD